MKKYIKPAVRHIALSEESALMSLSSGDLDGVTYKGNATDNIRVDSNKRDNSIWDND